MNIRSICNSIDKLITKARMPLAVIPSVMLVCSAINRPGLSAMLTASNIIRRQSEAGAIPGPSPDGGANISEAMERIRIEEIFKAIKFDGKVQIGVPIGGIRFSGTGASAAGPVKVEGFNVNSPYGVGIFG